MPSDRLLMGLEPAFLCPGVRRPAWICSSGPELGSLINQELSLYPIRTVFNYSAHFNVVEETCRKQAISLKQSAEQESGKDLRRRVRYCVAAPEKESRKRDLGGQT